MLINRVTPGITLLLPTTYMKYKIRLTYVIDNRECLIKKKGYKAYELAQSRNAVTSSNYALYAVLYDYDHNVLTSEL